MQGIFAASLALNGAALSLAVVLLSVFGHSHLAADLALVQGATLAIFQVFSANGRSLVMRAKSRNSALTIIRLRVFLLVPLGIAALVLAVFVSKVQLVFASVVILRRSAEWLAEVGLSEAEREARQHSVAAKIIFVDFVGVAALVLAADDEALEATAIVVWTCLTFVALWPALSPISHSARVQLTKGNFLPHFGSSGVIGITVFVFRMLIVSLMGKETGGELIAAFALGSLAGTLASNSVGPSIVLAESRGRGGFGISILRSTSWVLAVVGAVVLVIAWAGGWHTLFPRSSSMFWIAAGLSILGGAIMIAAQYQRLRLLQHANAESTFCADVAANLLIVLSVPILYHVSGGKWMVATYLVTSIEAWLIFRPGIVGAKLTRTWHKRVLWVVYVMIALPIFVQLQTGLFRDSSFIFDTGGVLSKLPLPLSLFACYGTLLFARRFESARLSFVFMFFVFAAMVLTTVISTAALPDDRTSKLTLLAQFLLPMFALPLGQVIGADEDRVKNVALAFLTVTVLIVPWQLMATWASGNLMLMPNLGVFSIYQHLQYVPLIMICSFLLGISAPSKANNSAILRIGLMVMSVFLGIYSVASHSVVTLFALISGLFVFALVSRRNFETTPNFWIILAGSSGGASIYGLVNLFPEFSGNHFSNAMRSPDVAQMLHIKAFDRFEMWRYYLDGATIDLKTFLFGNVSRPDRLRIPSAHNYYLDTLYNFGFIAVLPLFALVLVTARRLTNLRGEIFNRPILIGLAFVWITLVLIDNSLKVGLRQPFPGIFTFFIWGLLIAQLNDSRKITASGMAA